MRLSLIRDLIGDTGGQAKYSAVLKFCVEFTFKAQKDMALLAPVIGEVAGCVLDHPNADGPEVLCAPVGHAGLASMFGRFDVSPVRGLERKIGDLHFGGGLRPVRPNVELTGPRRRTA